ncbi:Alpha 1,3 fucosyltransferase, partial [Gryganskiella cystojenkinii]
MSATDRKEYPILWWTKWFGEDRYEGMLADQCGLPYSCKNTLDRTRYKDSPVVVFHDWDPKDLPPLKDVHDNTKAWVLNKAERPDPHHYQKKWMSLFTYRFTYHFGSDFIGTYFTAGRNTRDGLINLVSRPPLKLTSEKNHHREHGFHSRDSRPLAPIAWIASNCEATNGRHFMVKQLQKFVDVDVYGRCIPNRPWPLRADGSGKEMTDEELVSHYKFYLALENTNCDDYVTEKLWRPFAVGSVPVVDGPKDYSRFRPGTKSLIEYDDFGSPKALGAFLARLDEDDDSYEEFLSYRAKRNPENTDSQGQVRINEPETFNQDYKDRLLPWFIDNWDLDTSESLNKTTREWLSTGLDSSISGKTKASDAVSRDKYGMQWGPDYKGGLCALCREVHDLAEGIKKLPLYLPSDHPGSERMIKRLSVDRTCEFRKYYHASWIVAFYPYWTLFWTMLLAAIVWLTVFRRGRAVTRYGVYRARMMATRTLVGLHVIKKRLGRDSRQQQRHHEYHELSIDSGIV